MKKSLSTSDRRKARLFALIFGCAIMIGIGIGFCSCKAVRVYTTTATYVQSADTTKGSTTITTKTVEEYQGTKKK